MDLYASFGVPVEKGINMFQERFNLEEEYWPYDSIKKDFYWISNYFASCYSERLTVFRN
jgi:hypothetical protein